MAIAVVQTASVSNGGGGASGTVTFSSTPTPGNWLLFCVSNRGGETVGPPTGVTKDASGSSGTQGGGCICSRTVQAGDGTGWTFTTTADWMNILGFELSGVKTSSPYDATPVFVLANTSPSITPGQAGLAFDVEGSNSAGTSTAGSPWGTTTNVGASFHPLAVATTTNFTPGSPLAAAFTDTSSQSVVTEFVVLAAPAGGLVPYAQPGLAWRRHFQHRQLLPTFGGPAAAQNYTQNLTAGLSFTGGFTKATSYHLTAGLSFAGAMALRTGKLLTAGLSFTGAQARAIAKSMTAGLSFTGALPRTVAYHLTAALSFVGALTKRTTHPLTGGLSFTGGFAATIVIKRTLTASLSFTGSLATQVVHFFTQNLTAALSFTGAFTKQPGKALTAALSFTGSQSRRVGHLNAASLSFTGAQPRSIRSHLASVLSFIGNVTGFNPNAVGPPPYTVTASDKPAVGVTSTSSPAASVTGASASAVNVTSSTTP